MEEEYVKYYIYFLLYYSYVNEISLENIKYLNKISELINVLKETS